MLSGRTSLSHPRVQSDVNFQRLCTLRFGTTLAPTKWFIGSWDFRDIEVQIAKSHALFDRDDVLAHWRIVRAAGERGLRQQRQLQPIQDLFVGTREDKRCIRRGSNLERRQRRLSRKRRVGAQDRS